MNRKTMTMIAAGLAAAGLTVGVVSLASADEAPTSSVTEDTRCRDHHGDETELTGADAEQATAAAQAAVPDGTVLRVETDSHGTATYEAHVRKADGTEVVVFMDAGFAVTEVTERGGPGGPGRRGHDLTPLTGEDAAQATAAAQAAVPDGTVDHVMADDDGEDPYVALVRKADETHVVVFMDADFAVTRVEERPGPGGPGGRGHDGTPLTGEDAAQATAAAQAAVPDGTVMRVESDDDGTVEAHVRKADGTMALVTMDASFAVTSVADLPAPGRGHGPGGRGHGA